MFFVTTFEKMEPKEDPLGWENWDFGSMRTVGYYKLLSSAREVVVKNMFDICETIYHYAIIEKIDEGIYPGVIYRELYRVTNIGIEIDGKTFYNIDGLTFEKIDIPEDFTSRCFAGIG